jgi:hypothetical protein
LMLIQRSLIQCKCPFTMLLIVAGGDLNRQLSIGNLAKDWKSLALRLFVMIS